jgi:DNA-binding CsgD family transcriptional regulator
MTLKDTHPELLTDTDRAMLRMIAEGATSEEIAARLGLKHGTTRVYISRLYDRLGVKNKAEAIRWQLDQAPAVTAMVHQPATPVPSAASVADYAIHHGLRQLLGVFEEYVGPRSRVWAATQALEETAGEAVEPTDPRLIAEARSIWRALLSGDSDRGRQAFDGGLAGEFLAASHADLLLLAASLCVGRHRSRLMECVSLCERVVGNRRPRRSELKMVALLAAAAEGKPAAVRDLADLTQDTQLRLGLRQTLLAVRFHLHLYANDSAAAGEAATELFGMALEGARELGGTGDPLLGGIGVPDPSAVAPVSKRRKITAAA